MPWNMLKQVRGTVQHQVVPVPYPVYNTCTVAHNRYQHIKTRFSKFLLYLNQCWIGDPGWKKLGSGIRDKHPGSATLISTILESEEGSNEPLDSMWTRYLLKSLNSSQVGRNTMMLGTSVLEPGYDLHTTRYRYEYLSSNNRLWRIVW
jgi:hypothetical protein